MNTANTRTQKIIEKSEMPIDEEITPLEELADEALEDFIEGDTEPLDWRNM